jgi:RimJ/RimL family protein N-acetyltransferase
VGDTGDDRRVVARCVEAEVPREDLFVTSKLRTGDQGYDNARRSFEASLKRLGLEFMDLFLIHWPVPAQDKYAETWKAFIDLLMEGRGDGDRRLRDLVAKAVRTRLTDRLRLEPIGAEHVNDLVRLHGEPGIARWFGHTWSRDYAVAQAREKAVAWESAGVSKWIAYDRKTGELIGRGGMDRLDPDRPLTHRIAAVVPDSWMTDRLEVGWTVAGAAQRRGYATEIGGASLDFARAYLGARIVVAFTEDHNAASRAVMERLGMAFAGNVTGSGLAVGGDEIWENAVFAVYWTDVKRK